jgi:hypothetical protein
MRRTGGPPDCDRREHSQSCSPWYIASRLGHRERSAPWIFGQIQQLIDHAGFPPPIVRLIGGEPVEGIRQLSRWQREAVDRWFDSQPSARLAIPLAQAADQVEQDRVDRELHERAQLIAEGKL